MYFFGGRFQPFHNAHLEIIDKLLSIAKQELLIGITVKKRSLNDPFTFVERQIMIQRALQDAKVDLSLIYYTPLFVPRALEWEVNKSLLPPNTIWCISTKESQRVAKYRELGEQVHEVNLNRTEISATIIRNRIIAGESWEELVPDAVAKYMHQINAQDRIIEYNDNNLNVNEPVAGLANRVEKLPPNRA